MLTAACLACACSSSSTKASVPHFSSSRQALNVKEGPYNATGDGNDNDGPAIQKALDDACLTAINGHGEVVYLPRGVYYTTQMLRLHCPRVHLMGDGLTQSYIQGNLGFGPILYVGPESFAPSNWGTAIAPGSTSSQHSFILRASGNYMLNLGDSPGAGSKLNGLSAFAVAMWLQPTSTNSGGGVILSSSGARPMTVKTRAYDVMLQNNNLINCDIQTSVGSFRVTSATPLVLNTTAHVACTYDGALFRVFINGVQTGATPATGTLSRSVFEQHTLGQGLIQDFVDGDIGAGMPDVLVSSLLIYPQALYTTNFTPPAQPYGYDGVAQFVSNFDGLSANGISAQGIDTNGQRGNLILRDYSTLSEGGQLVGVEVSDIGLEGRADESGIYMFSSINSEVHDVRMQNLKGPFGLYVWNNSFESNFHDIQISSNASDTFNVRDPVIAGVLTSTQSGLQQLSNIFVQSSAQFPFMALGAAGGMWVNDIVAPVQGVLSAFYAADQGAAGPPQTYQGCSADFEGQDSAVQSVYEFAQTTRTEVLGSDMVLGGFAVPLVKWGAFSNTASQHATLTLEGSSFHLSGSEPAVLQVNRLTGVTTQLDYVDFIGDLKTNALVPITLDPTGAIQRSTVQ